VLECADAIGTGVSARNSEVVHAGLYYPPGSLKAKACISGKSMLYAYCAARGVPVKRVGKLVVATKPEQVAELERIRTNAAACGMDDLALLDANAVKAMEPEIACVAALHSPSTGIVDSHALMLALQGDIEASGGIVVCRAPVLSIAAQAQGFVVAVGGDAPMELACDILINAASLHAPGLAVGMAGYDAELAPSAYYAKGHYFALSGVRPPFQRLVYPVPEPGGLGIHATVDLGGQVRFGPDVEWVAALDYAPDDSRAVRFSEAIAAYWPGIARAELTASYTGIRPKISGPGEPNADFMIQGEAQHGVKGLVHLFGIESPGLTSCLALGDMVLETLGIRGKLAATADAAA
jgi:L-2-hydroxyglutarate oxidase LhgO